jgi:ABC-2 type transport system ATP-binding protein
LIEIIGITKKYSHNYVLTDVSLNASGTVAILGGKQAGKTALADIIAGCVYPESGSVSICGHDISRDTIAAKAALGYMPQQLSLYPEMTPEDYLSFVCSLCGLKGIKASKSRDEALDKAGISPLSSREIKALSLFEQKRLSLAGALCGSPKALILDEPMGGLTPEQAFAMQQTIKSLSGDHTIVLFTRSIHEAAEICESIAVLKGGRITARETIKDLLGAWDRQRRITVRLKCDRHKGLEILKSIEGVEYVEALGSREGGTYDYIVEAQDRDLREDIFGAAVEADVIMLGMGCVSVTLDDICAGLTGGAPE